MGVSAGEIKKREVRNCGNNDRRYSVVAADSGPRFDVPGACDNRNAQNVALSRLGV